MLVTPSEVVSSVTTSLFDFIWCKKPDKIKRQVMYQDYVNGGLRVPNMEVMAKSLKLAWISRFLSTDVLSRKENWKAIPYHFFREYEILVGNRPFFLRNWFDSGIVSILDILRENGKFLSFQEFQQIYKIKCNFLHYYQVVSAIPKHLLERAKQTQLNKTLFLDRYVSPRRNFTSGVSNNSNCTYCGQPDSISHTFIGDKELLFGKSFNTIDQLQRAPLLKKLNYCMLLAKYYLYNQKLNQIEPELNEFKNRLNLQYLA
ncbi:hypothetical protein P5673_019049 [Acropora cervicornis]|uniref:Uncharacterized protein n=1 Tax=Acropora cervicornis TaxID=6130 RepID=A0AAD9QCM6_ACRCE|nr:hypothetical protein P5673_019049 [Acropora cervicornis]